MPSAPELLDGCVADAETVSVWLTTGISMSAQGEWWPGTGSNRRHADFQSAPINALTCLFNYLREISEAL